MSNGWYYARDAKKIGPVSPQQLKDLADAGTILATDTIWKEGNEQGVRASRVKNLFAPIVAAAALPALEEAEMPTLAPLVPYVKPEEVDVSAFAALPPASAPPVLVAENSVAAYKPKGPAGPGAPASQPKPASKGRAVALRGADIVSQDGTQARYRMKCETCKHQDSSCHALTITSKTFKKSFFCPKCRKRREVTIQCQMR